MKMPPLERETKYPKPPGTEEIPVKGPSPPAPVAFGEPYQGASKFDTPPFETRIQYPPVAESLVMATE